MSDSDSTLDNLDLPDLIGHFVDWAGRYLTWYNLNHSHMAREPRAAPGSPAHAGVRLACIGSTIPHGEALAPL